MDFLLSNLSNTTQNINFTGKYDKFTKKVIDKKMLERYNLKNDCFHRNPIQEDYQLKPKYLEEKVSVFLTKLQNTLVSTINQRLRPVVSDDIAIATAKRITDDPKLQQALVKLAKEEAIVIRTKADATPIMKEQFFHLKNKENVVILDINPQLNNGMQKSNSLISRWFSEVNDIPAENLITLRSEELRTKAFKPNEFSPEWVQGDKVAKQLERLQNKVDTISMDKVRAILDDIKGMSSEEILSKYSLEELASVMRTVNTNIVAPQKKCGYIGGLISQLETASKGKDEITLVIPDDCSLSGSSMLCDSVKILDKFASEHPEKKVHVVFSPLILGENAETAFARFIDKSKPLDDMYLAQISAIKSDGTEAFPGIRKAFEKVRNSDNLSFEVTLHTMKAKHFTETEGFKNINDPVLKSELTYIMQGPIDNGYAQFGGFGKCGTLVITPTEEFVIDGKTYAGKIPTNSVGFMEVLGHEAGVLNDESVKGKGLFTKGTGKGYSRYCEWEGLAHPENPNDRIPVVIEKDGSIKKA